MNNVVESVYSQMVDLIFDGTWEAGNKIPTENELAEMFQLSKNRECPLHLTI